MKAPIKASIFIDDKQFGEFEAEVELPDNDDENNEQFDKDLMSILKVKILEDEQMKAFVTWLIAREQEGMPEDEQIKAVNDFFDRRLRLEIKI